MFRDPVVETSRLHAPELEDMVGSTTPINRSAMTGTIRKERKEYEGAGPEGAQTLKSPPPAEVHEEPAYPQYKTIRVGAERLIAYIFLGLLIAVLCIVVYLMTYKYTDAELERFWWTMLSTFVWTVFVFEFVVVGLAYLYHWMVFDEVEHVHPFAEVEAKEKNIITAPTKAAAWMAFERHPYEGEIRALTRDDKTIILKRHEKEKQKTTAR